MCPAFEERMRSLQLLQKPSECVAQLSGAVFVVPTAVREDDAVGLAGQHRLDSLLQSVPVSSREFQPQITRRAGVRRCDAADGLKQNEQQAVDLPGFRIRQQVAENERAAKAQRQPSENERAGAR